jgi:molybdate transport system ATP-binding protein
MQSNAAAQHLHATQPGDLPAAPLRAGHLHVALRCAAPVPLQVEFDCAPGELVALVGPSGSGKTTLLRAVAGLYQPRVLQGTVQLHAASGVHTWFDSTQRIALPPQARRVGLVFQQYALFPHLSAIDNIAVCADNTWTTQQKRSQSITLLASMGLAHVAQRLPHQLSGGQQQRVALARALVRLLPLDNAGVRSNTDANHALPRQPTNSPTPPGVLLLDEPFSAVDAPMRQTLYRELAQLHASVALPIVLVTHDLAEARRLADKVVIIDGGTTLQSGPPERVLSSPRNARVAQLVGIHNHFAGQFVRSATPGGHATVHWGGCALQAIDKDRIADHSAVTWVLAGDSVQVLAAQTHPSAEGDNLLPCQLTQMLPLGEICVCQLAVHGAPATDAVQLNLSTALLRSLGAQPGSQLLLHVPAQALHIMPLRSA